MKKTLKREPGKSLIFDLTDEGANFRVKWRGLTVMTIWLGLSGIAMLLTVFSAESTKHKLVLIAMSLVKYIPLLIVVYSLSRKKAAKYLADVYELDNEDAAPAFLEEVAFGQAHHKITIKNGRMSDKDEESPLILIGGPGFIQVNLDNVALLEKATGEPEVIYPRKGAWKLGSFERLREIGDSDEVGEREYAIINLREQIFRISSVKSRTKDGIPVEARGIEATFNVLHRQESQGSDFPFDERAVQTLVYKQTTITPEKTNLSNAGFPWDTTIIPLIIAEIEQVIASHTSNEILASIGQKEIDLISTAEQTAAQMRIEITGKHQAYSENKGTIVSKSISRATITERFYHPPFTDKAAALGVRLNWIDIGTWEPSAPIRDKIKNAWKTAADNIKKHGSVEAWKKQYTDKETLNLIDVVALSFSDKIAEPDNQGREASRRKLESLLLVKPEIASDPSFQAQIDYLDSNKKGSTGTAFEMLKAFRKELLAGQALIEEKEKPTEETQADLVQIARTLDGINNFFPRPSKKSL